MGKLGSSAFMATVLAALLAAGCANPLDSAESVGPDFVPAPLGMDVCYDCHASDVFVEWVQSRHANFDYEDAEAGRPDPLDPDSFGGNWATIVGDTNRMTCDPCHTGWPNLQGLTDGDLLDTLTYGYMFTNPNLGEVARPVIGCEGCHVSGTGHMGAAQPPVVPVPALHVCGECHGLIEDDHGIESYRVWANTLGESLTACNEPVASTTNLGGLNFTIWTAPDAAAWIQTCRDSRGNLIDETYAGPYFVQTERTIHDSHFNRIWITNEGNKVTLYTVPTAKFGYVDLTDGSPNSGMVRGDSEEACTGSCHKPHLFDQIVNEQWFEGAHHPNIQGPLGTDEGDVVPVGPANWGAVDHGGYSSSCLRCHTSMGFGEIAPGYGSAVETPARKSDGFITCNACHDGENYPSSSDKAMRIDGIVALYNYGGTPLTYVDGGTSSGCIYCHQGREDGSRVAGDVKKYNPAMMDTTNYPSYMTSTASNPVRFRNMHYLPAGAMIYGEKGFEYTGKSYIGPYVHSYIQSSCAACHMADTDPPSTHLGGHTFHMAYGSTQNTEFCTPCHGPLSDYTALRYHTGDWDGDSNTGDSAYSEVETLKASLLAAIEAYDSPDDADTTAQVYHVDGNPYFSLNERAGADTSVSQAWDPPLAKAAFNWQYVAKDPGAFAHNPKYAVQLLRDSYADLKASAANSLSIPALGGDRP